MTQEDYLKRFEQICQELIEVTRKKGNDYAGQSNVFRNFELIENLTEGRISTADGLIVRLTDKLMRAANLLTRENSVADERIYDTTKDAATYSIILTIWLEQLAKKEEPADPYAKMYGAQDQAQVGQNIYPDMWGQNLSPAAMNVSNELIKQAPVDPHPSGLFHDLLRKMREAA